LPIREIIAFFTSSRLGCISSLSGHSETLFAVIVTLGIMSSMVFEGRIISIPSIEIMASWAVETALTGLKLNDAGAAAGGTSAIISAVSVSPAILSSSVPASTATLTSTLTSAAPSLSTIPRLRASAMALPVNPSRFSAPVALDSSSIERVPG